LHALTGLRERRAQGSLNLAAVADALEALHAQASHHLEAPMRAEISIPWWRTFGPQQITAETPFFDPCSEERNCASAQYIDESGAAGAMAYENKPANTPALVKRKTQPTEPADDIVNVSLPLLRSAFVHLSEMVPEVFDHWAVFVGGRASLPTLLPQSPSLSGGREVLGQDLAIVALALTAERKCKWSVSNPGGYLRARQSEPPGDLRLSRSLFGMAASTQTTFVSPWCVHHNAADCWKKCRQDQFAGKLARCCVSYCLSETQPDLVPKVFSKQYPGSFGPHTILHGVTFTNFARDLQC